MTDAQVFFKGKNPGLPSPFFIIDFDDVLFPKKEIQADVTLNLAQATGGKDLFTAAYKEIRARNNGFVDVKEVCREFREKHKLLFDPYDFFKDINLQPYAHQLQENQNFLTSLNKKGITFKIITQGNEDYQRHKLEKSGILAVIDPQTQLIISAGDKVPVILQEIKRLDPQLNCVIADDKAEILERTKKSLEGQRNITTCKIGPWSKSEIELYHNSSQIDFSLMHVNQMLGLLRNGVHEGKPPLENIARR